MGQLEQEYQYYRDHHEELKQKYLNKIVVIAEDQVHGPFGTDGDAMTFALEKFEPGSFLIHRVSEHLEDEVQTFHSRVSIA